VAPGYDGGMGHSARKSVVINFDDSRKQDVIVPGHSRRRRIVRTPSPVEIDELMALAGAWNDVDADKQIEAIYTTRDASARVLPRA